MGLAFEIMLIIGLIAVLIIEFRCLKKLDKINKHIAEMNRICSDFHNDIRGFRKESQ